MERILITGALGQVGLALYSLLKDNPSYELVRTDFRLSEDGQVVQLDITDEEAVNYCINNNKPDIIINCTGYTAVDLCESNQEAAYAVNALGPKYLAMAADRIRAKLIHISTDYVYDGKANKPYKEEDDTNPLSVYGKTKLEGDNFVSRYCSRYFILRTAWVYGEGKNFVRTMLRLAGANSNIRVVADQFGSPTSAIELARVIIFLMQTESYGLYHAVCEGFTSWYEFAVEIFRKVGIEVTVEPIKTSEYRTAAVRPMYSVLDNKALRERHGYHMKCWQEALREYEV